MIFCDSLCEGLVLGQEHKKSRSSVKKKECSYTTQNTDSQKSAGWFRDIIHFYPELTKECRRRVAVVKDMASRGRKEAPEGEVAAAGMFMSPSEMLQSTHH